MFRIGHGYDFHKFETSPPYKNHITLGGVTIPHTKGLIAHSDGDVVIHALCDALLGAAALRDIGHYFPDNDSKFKNIDSRQLLREVIRLLSSKNYSPHNIDITIVAQKPKMAPHIDAMREILASDLSLPIENVGIKATTTEGLDATGREEAIAVHAVVLIVPNS